MRSQRTIKKEVFFEGVGLHSGTLCRVVLRPAPVDNGVLFHRVDKNVTFHSHVGMVLETEFATTIGTERAKVRTVEHLLACINALGLDNLIVEVEGPEIPILDGSGIEIARLIMEAGIRKQRKKMPYIRILEPIILEDKHGAVSIYPYEGRKISFRLYFENHFLGEQTLTVDLDEESFIQDIAPARTFGFLKDIEYIRSKGLAKGGSLDNAIIFSDSSVINESGLRFDDECVRHKILDSIGDFALAGFPIMGHIIADKSGHTINIRFLSKLLSCNECWEVVTEHVPYNMPAFSYSYI